MRRLLGRRIVSVIATVVAFTAIPAAGIIATATPALASVNVCNTFGSYCIGGPAIGIGDPVVLTATGRDINIVDRGYTCCGGIEVVQLQFAANTARCVGIMVTTGGTGLATVRDCSGGKNAGVDWGEVPLTDGSQGVEFYSNSQAAYLASDNILNDQLYIAEPSHDGDLLKWNF